MVFSESSKKFLVWSKHLRLWVLHIPQDIAINDTQPQPWFPSEPVPLSPGRGACGRFWGLDSPAVLGPTFGVVPAAGSHGPQGVPAPEQGPLGAVDQLRAPLIWQWGRLYLQEHTHTHTHIGSLLWLHPLVRLDLQALVCSPCVNCKLRYEDSQKQTG